MSLVEERYAICLSAGKLVNVCIRGEDIHHSFQILALVGIGYVYAASLENGPCVPF